MSSVSLSPHNIQIGMKIEQNQSHGQLDIQLRDILKGYSQDKDASLNITSLLTWLLSICSSLNVEKSNLLFS